MPETEDRLTDQEIYELAAKHLPLDVYERAREQSYREANGRHISHRAILPGLLVIALIENYQRNHGVAA